jgi:hypothetical protein
MDGRRDGGRALWLIRQGLFVWWGSWGDDAVRLGMDLEYCIVMLWLA